MIFYFHGFGSSENSKKAGMLKVQMPPGTVLTPTLPLQPQKVVELFERTIDNSGKPELLVGSSLGGFYASYASVRFDIPAVLLNPSLKPWMTLSKYVGMNERYHSGEPFEWEASYLEELKRLADELETYVPKHHLLHFHLATDDEILDLSVIPSKFLDAASITFYDNCQHDFTRFDEVIPEIKMLIKSG